jgi:hypothetical protein
LIFFAGTLGLGPREYDGEVFGFRDKTRSGNFSAAVKKKKKLLSLLLFVCRHCSDSLHDSVYLICVQPSDIGIVAIPILQMGKLRFGEVK